MMPVSLLAGRTVQEQKTTSEFSESPVESGQIMN